MGKLSYMGLYNGHLVEGDIIFEDSGSSYKPLAPQYYRDNSGSSFDPFKYPIVSSDNQISVISSQSLWKCVYCGRINPPNLFECAGCGSGRME